MSAKQYAAAAEMLAFLETERDVPQAEVWAGLASCQVHATLALVEETEVVAEQLRRLADVGEALLLLLQPLADRAAAGGVLASDVVEGAETRPGAREQTARWATPRCESTHPVEGGGGFRGTARCSLFAGHGLPHHDHEHAVEWSAS